VGPAGALGGGGGGGVVEVVVGGLDDVVLVLLGAILDKVVEPHSTKPVPPALVVVCMPTMVSPHWQ
jgi:hypothetical protein